MKTIHDIKVKLDKYNCSSLEEKEHEICFTRSLAKHMLEFIQYHLKDIGAIEDCYSREDLEQQYKACNYSFISRSHKHNESLNVLNFENDTHIITLFFSVDKKPIKQTVSLLEKIKGFFKFTTCRKGESVNEQI